ncbi:MAG: hypothetical protein LBF00_03725 [Mycoplasmataceae bacterium]|nr:hypothetical protein [Mycoplasmataceae bacterium]
MRSRKLDSPLKTRLDIRFIAQNKINKIISRDKYQVVQICWHHVYRQNHIPFAVHFTPMNFIHQYKNKLNLDSKIVIVGNWKKMVKFYRVLDFANYNVYLLK